MVTFIVRVASVAADGSIAFREAHHRGGLDWMDGPLSGVAWPANRGATVKVGQRIGVTATGSGFVFFGAQSQSNRATS